MHYLLFTLYLIFFAWLGTRVPFFSRSGLSQSQLVVIFLSKVFVGIIYAWIGIYYKDIAKGSDTWMYHYAALKEYDLLLKSPYEFFVNLFHNSYGKDGMDFFSVENSWWNDVKSNSFLKILALLNVFSFGNYYINLILYSFITLFGVIALYRVMKDVFKQGSIEVLLCTFFLPSFIYWTSGVHKDGILFLCISLIIFHIYFSLKTKKISLSALVIIPICLFLILLLRNFLLIPLIPALLAWVLSARMHVKPIYTYTGIYLLFLIFFFAAKFIHPSLDLPAATLYRQESFIALAGGSDLSVDRLHPSLTGFIKLLPQALFLTVLQPTFETAHHLLSLAACIEINFYLLLLLIFLILKNKKPVTNSSFILFCLFFSFSFLLMIGYSVNNVGAIVRYRSIILPLLIVPLVAKINWQRIGKTLLNI